MAFGSNSVLLLTLLLWQVLTSSESQVSSSLSRIVIVLWNYCEDA